MLAFFPPQPIGGGVRGSLTPTLPPGPSFAPWRPTQGTVPLSSRHHCVPWAHVPLGLGVLHAEAGDYRLPHYTSFSPSLILENILNPSSEVTLSWVSHD